MPTESPYALVRRLMDRLPQRGPQVASRVQSYWRDHTERVIRIFRARIPIGQKITQAEVSLHRLMEDLIGLESVCDSQEEHPEVWSGPLRIVPSPEESES